MKLKLRSLIGLFALSGQLAFADPIAPSLGAATNFGQGIQRHTMLQADAFDVEYYRDGMNWRRVEQKPGSFNYSDPRTRYPIEIEAGGGDLTIVLNWGNPLYDGGATPFSDEGIAAMGRYASNLVATYPFIAAVEVGNEINGVNFVRGPLKEMTSLERAAAYSKILVEVSRSVRATNPDIRILGGATHSLPGEFIWTVLDNGGAGAMDALAIHPYTTPAEQFVRQVNVLRRHPALREMPFEVTEFGTSKPSEAASHMLRNYCQFALGGVTNAIWFPGNLRKEQMVPLFQPDGRITPAGKSFRFINEHMVGRPVSDASIDAFSYGCKFGKNVLVLWGAPRNVNVDEGTSVFLPDGTLAVEPFRVDETKPLIFISETGEVLSKIEIEETALVADSFHQFAYPLADEMRVANDGFERFAVKRGIAIPLQTMPGQERSGVPWFPYRGHPAHPGIRLTSESLLPGQNTDILHRFEPETGGSYTFTTMLKVPDRSEDGIVFEVLLSGKSIATYDVQPGENFMLDDFSIDLRGEDTLDFLVGSGASARGDLVQYRFAVSDLQD